MAETNDFDQASRFLTKLDAAGVISWLTGMPAEAFAFVGWLDTRMVPWPGDPERTCDTVAYLRDLEDGGWPWAVVIEYQVEPDPLMFGRLLVYLGQVWLSVKPSPERGDRFFVGRIVVNLTGVGNTAIDMHWPRAGFGTALRRPDENLCQRDAAGELDAIAAGKVSRAVLGWIPLMQGGGEDAIIQRWKELADTDPLWRAEVAAVALVYGEATPRADAWKKALEGWNVMKSKQVAEWQEQAEVRTWISSSLEVLEGRFGALPPDLISQMQAVAELKVIRRWPRLAGTAATLDDFRRDAGL